MVTVPVLLREGQRLLMPRERGLIGMPQGILVGETAVVLGTHFSRHLGLLICCDIFSLNRLVFLFRWQGLRNLLRNDAVFPLDNAVVAEQEEDYDQQQ